MEDWSIKDYCSLKLNVTDMLEGHLQGKMAGNNLSDILCLEAL